MFINTAAGKRFQVDISAEDNIRTLKNMIMDETGAPPKHQALSFNGVEMNNNKASLASYGVDPSSSEIQVGLVMNGGCGAGCNICGAGGGCHCTIL